MFRTYTKVEDSAYIVTSSFSENIAENLKNIMSFCIKNSLNFYVSYNELSTYEVRIDVDRWVAPQLKELMSLLSQLKKVNYA